MIKQALIKTLKSPNFLLLIIAIVSYRQIFFLQHSVTWDLLDTILPWKYFITECFKNNIFPLWNPYQQLGYPMHADLKTVLNPETFLIAKTIGYNNYILHFLLIMYLYLAGVGMYKLSRFIYRNKTAAFVAGIAFMLCGYMVSQAQDLPRIAGAAWVPFILYYYLKMVENARWQSIFKLCLFLFLLITGGYQAISIILFYLLALLALYLLIKKLREKNKAELLKFIRSHAILLVLMIGLMAVVFVTVYQVTPHVQRLGGLSLKQAQFCPFSPQSAISFILPFATVKDVTFFDTDISMNNAYAGIFMLAFFMLALFRRKSSVEWIIAIFGTGCLLASFGSYFPLHKFLFSHVPGFNLFRFPSYFVLFFSFSVILLASGEIVRFGSNFELHKKRIYLPLTLVALALFSFMILFHSGIRHVEIPYFNSGLNLFEQMKAATFNQHVVIQSVVQIALLLIFAFFIFKNKKPDFVAFGIALMVFAEMMLAVQFNIGFTAFNEGNPKDIKAFLESQPKEWPVPTGPVASYTDAASSHFPLWRNTNCFSKKPSFEGFNSFQLNSHECLYDSFPQLKEATLQNPVLFLSDQVFSEKNIPDSLNPKTDNKKVFIPQADLQKLKIGKLNPTDTVQIQEFKPGFIKATVTSHEPILLTCLQSNYPGWKATVAGRETEIINTNKMFMSVLVPAGNNQVEFTYSNHTFMKALWFSYAILGLIILSLLINGIWQAKKKILK